MSVHGNIKRTLQRSSHAVTGFHKLEAVSTALLYRLSPVWLAKLRYRAAWGRWPQFANPQTFAEKLLWLMLYWRHPLKTVCGDKFTMRSYVAEHGFEHLLPGLYGVYETSREIDFDLLPDRFVLKCTHGCKFNIICQNKVALNKVQIRQQLDAWLKVDFSQAYGEVHYADMKPRIIAEEYLQQSAGELPVDYKVYCFAGRAHCTLACTGRQLNDDANYDIYDRSWKTKLPYSKSSLLADRSIPKPEAYEEILAAAEALSQPFPFVRMDFYSIQGRAVLGEMTFTPAGCVDPGYTDLAQRELGALVRLPAKRLK